MAENTSKIKNVVKKITEDTAPHKGMNGGDPHGKNTKSKRNYKLLIDPAIKKGHQKIYRFDGTFPGQPPVVPRDPRPPRAKLWTATVAELQLPRFKVDKYYVGCLPENTVRFGCLNDNINRQFLRELCSKFGKIEEYKVYYDIKSKKHLGTGKITFSTSSSARQAVMELDGSSVMGNIIRVSIERKKNRHPSHDKAALIAHGSKDPREFRDPRRSSTTGPGNAVLPTPSPSQYSPSVESTPPTPLVSAMNRSHPVAHIKHGHQRRTTSLDTDPSALESPASICSASFNSSTFEPISPPAVPRIRSLSSDNASLPPPPPPDKSSNLPPPPPPTKQGIYEDISPTANFDDESKSPVGSERKVHRNVEKEKRIVSAHLLGLKIACRGENKGAMGQQDTASSNADGCKMSESKNRYDDHGRSKSPSAGNDVGNYHSSKEYSRKNNEVAPPRNERVEGKSENYNRASHAKTVAKHKKESNDKMVKNHTSLSLDLKGKNESVYEAISDSDDDVNVTQPSANKNMQVEDISPVNSPVHKNSLNGNAKQKEVQSNPSLPIMQDTSVCKKVDEVNNDVGCDDDDDDAMSLSSISSNEESSLVLNTPAIPVATISSTPFPPFPNQANVFVNSTPNLPLHPRHPPSNVVGPPPVNIPAPPPSVNVPPPSQMNMQPVNLRQPPINVPQTPVITRLPPPPPVNIHVPPPGMTFNQSIPPPPYRHPAGQPPQMRPSQAPPPSYPPKSASGGFLGSYSRPYAGFFSGNYKNYRDFGANQNRPIAEVVREIPYEEKVKASCTTKTKKDLKGVLHRDLIKRLVEHAGFAALEAWWDNQTKKKDLNIPTCGSSDISHSNAPQLLNISHSESPSTSTTSSLLLSLFGRSQQSSSSPNMMPSPIRGLGPVSKIPSFRINRIPQARPVGREALMSKRAGRTGGEDVPRKFRKLSVEEEDEERTVKEEESESDSESETERGLLASRRPTVKSGSSLYQRIYESSESEESEDTKSIESDEEDDDYKFQELIHEQQKLKREQMRIKEKEKIIERKEEEFDEMDEDEDAEEMSVDEEAGSSEEDEEDDDEEEMEDDQEDESESEWESSGAEEAVQEVMKETEKKLEQFKEKSMKKEEQERKREQHEKLMSKYLKRTNETWTQSRNKISPQEAIMKEREFKNEKSDLDRSERESKSVDVKRKRDLEMNDITNKLEDGNVLALEGHLKGKENETLNKVLEETIEETEILSKVTELGGSEIKEELISEEVITIEPEEEVFNEHSYASTMSYEKESGRAIESNLNKEKGKPESPVIDVVDLYDEKELVHKKIEPKPVFPMRSIDDENVIVWKVLREGIDGEDLKYLQSAFESLHGFGSDVVKDHHWYHHPETLIQTRQKRSKGEPMLRVHKTGSARSEGHYKIPMSEKAQYLSSVMRQLETKEESQEKESDGLKHKQQSRENRAMQRRLVSSFVNDDFGDLVKFNKLKSRKKKLKFSKSGIHNWGLFTCEPIAAEEMVIEYVGEIVRSVIADSREKHYERTGIGSSYMFRLDAETVIDATKVGNNARFINHSCAPNCYAKVINVENEKKIVIYSKFDIKMNDEITYDYKFPIEEVKIECLCGTPQCRGTLN